MQKSEAGLGFWPVYPQQLSFLVFRKEQGISPCFHPVFLRKRYSLLMDQKQKVFVILMDNLRLDQWSVLYPIISEYYIPLMIPCSAAFCPPQRNMHEMPCLPD